jgi:phage tail-like protein
MPATLEHDADFQGSFFSLEIDNVTLAYFTACSGISLEFEPITFKQGDGKMIVERKRPGRPKYTEVVLKRGLTLSDDLYKWFDEVVKAAKATPYKTASIVIFGRDAKEVARFSLLNCWPSKLSVSDLSSGSDDVMIEEVTIQHEFLDWVK